MIKYDQGGQSRLVGHMASHYKYQKVLFDRNIYGNPSKVVFEGKEYSAPNRVDDYLKQYYGDYMSVPSADQQDEFYNEYASVEIKKSLNAEP